MAARKPEFVALWLTLPATLAAVGGITDLLVSRDQLRRLNATLIGKLLGVITGISGFALAPLALLALLVYTLRLTEEPEQRSGWSRRTVWTLWALIAFSIVANIAFWDAVRRASLSF